MTTLAILSASSAFGQSTAANSTTYFEVTGTPRNSSIESQATITMRAAGNFQNLYVRITTNSVGTGNTSTFTMHNATTPANLNETISVAGGSAGEFEDTINTDTITVGNKYDIVFVPGATTGTLGVTVVRPLFNTTTNTATRLGDWMNNSLGGVNTTYYLCIVGGDATTTATEANVKTRQRLAGTYQNFMVNLLANSRTTATTYNSRIDTGSGSVNGNMTISIPSGGGVFEDTVNSDSVSPGNDFNNSFTTGSDSGHNFAIGQMAITFVSTSGFTYCSASSNSASNTGTTAARYAVLSGSIGQSTSETNSQTKAGENKQFRELTAFYPTNSGTSTVNFRKNGSNGNMIISAAAGGTGAFSDSLNVDYVVSTDELAYRTINGASSGVTIQSISTWAVKGTSISVPETLSFLDH